MIKRTLNRTLGWQRHNLIIVLLGTLSLVSCTTEDDGPQSMTNQERWYSPEQVKLGRKVYTANCISCHLENAKGTKEWKKTLADGSYPPPPLDGSAHAWHHSIEVLTRVIQEGGIPYGGRMPPFKDVLSQKEQLAVIAYFQSFWSEEIYTRWEDITR